MSASSSHTRVGTTSSQDELIALGHNWFIHNPNLRSVRVRYEAIPKDHLALHTAERALEKIVRVLVRLNGCRASIVPCLHRTAYDAEELPVVLHLTLLNVEVMQMTHLMKSAVPVHLYIGDPLTTGTPFEAYSPEKLVIPRELRPGDPIFSPSTERITVFSAYLHLADDGALYGLTAGQAVVPQPGFIPHPRLMPQADKHQQRVRTSQLALQYIGRPLSNPAVKVVERALRMREAENAMLSATDSTEDVTRITPRDAEHTMLQDSLARPHEYDVGHACAAEAIIRPCNSSSHSRSAKSSRRQKEKEADHTHLLSWALFRISAKTADNPVTLRGHPGKLECGAAVTMQVNDPNLERPLGPYRDGVVNGTPASVVIDGHVAREWAVFPTPGKSVRFAARGDAGALVTSTGRDGERDGGTMATPLAILYAIPERGPYGLVTSLTTIIRRIRDVTGMQLRFQGSWWVDGYG